MKVGILGGGQLARMLALEAPRLGLDVHVLASSLDEPAALVCPHTQLGKLDNENDLTKFFNGLDAVTVESEFLDTSLIQKTIGKLSFHPKPEILEILQDRLTQKELLKKYGIPSSEFLAWNAQDGLPKLQNHFTTGFVLKKRRFGYDGYGTFVFKNNDGKMPPSDPYGYIAESFVPFKRELAFSLARNSKNEFAVFPLVETHQVNSRCLWVKGPIKSSKLTLLANRFKKMMKDLDYQGILAVELFELKGQLLVNELAPRVHNSGHYSMDALSMSQFEASLRGILGWPLKNPKPLTKAFAMVNLLGEKTSSPVKFSLEPVGRLHWYGKKENRKGRKMGHINTFGNTPEEALKSALNWRKEFEL